MVDKDSPLATLSGQPWLDCDAFDQGLADRAVLSRLNHDITNRNTLSTKND